MPLELDLNNPAFQRGLVALEKAEAVALLKTLRKLLSLEWIEVQRDSGLKYELVHSVTGANGERAYTIRVTQKCRAVVLRSGNTMRFLALHSDHDFAHLD